MNRQTDVETLNKKITEWEIKYEEDVEAVKKEYNLLLTYTDIERQVNHKALKGLQDRIDFTQHQLRAVQNILRTPRLTTIYQREMAK